MNRSNLLLVAFAMLAFLGAAVLAIVPLGGGVEFTMPIDLAKR